MLERNWKKPIVFSASTDDIIKVLPEYSGVLLGDKARDRIFDNSKIVDAAPDFRNFKPFAVGIAETIKIMRVTHEKEPLIMNGMEGLIGLLIS